MPGIVEIQKVFLSSPKFAVVGASKDQTKYGTKVGESIVTGPLFRLTSSASGFKVVLGA